ncbi:MAG: isocitrate/isopropylmalate dehydrogenase family protein, partial [Anaerovoracaceae bacterium]
MEQLKAIEQIIKEQLARVERLKQDEGATDFAKLDKIVVGTIAGDGIGPIIMDSCEKILGKLLAEEIAAGKIEQ